MMYIINKSLIALVISYECSRSGQITAVVTKVFVVLHKLLFFRLADPSIEPFFSQLK